MTTTASLPRVPLRQDAATISLIGLAHGTSHFFQLLLAPLFPIFIREFGLNYAELGLLVTLFYVVSGAGQALAGFVVDRIGARPVLLASMVCFAAAALAASLAQGFWSLALASVLAGLGNAPLHPSDFTILNKRVSSPRLGHAYSVHGISGNLGWAAAPAFLLGITAWTGNWRYACAGAALVALGVLALLVAGRTALDDRAIVAGRTAPGGPPASAPEHALAFLKLPAVWLCFSFFFWSTVALSAIQGFAGPALGQMHGLPLTTTAYVVTGYMLCGAAGMVVGGFMVVRIDQLERIIAAALLASASLLLLVGTGWVPGAIALGVVSLAGFGAGIAGPSRDMLIKRAAPPGATGRVYGTVYSGLDVGFAMAAPVFGLLLDQGQAGGVFVGSALALLAAVGSAALIGRRGRAPVAAPAG